MTILLTLSKTRVKKMDSCCSGVVQVFVGEWSPDYEALLIKATKQTSSAEIVECIIERLGLNDANISNGYELAEVVGNSVGQECKERRLGPSECPVALMLLWPKNEAQQEYYRFYLRKKQPDLWSDSRFPMDPQLLKYYFNRFLYQPRDKEYPDLCQLSDLNEQTLLDNIRVTHFRLTRTDDLEQPSPPLSRTLSLGSCEIVSAPSEF